MAQKHGIVYAFIFFYVCMIQHNKALLKHLYSLDVKITPIYINRAVLGTKAHLSSETQIWNKTEFQMLKEQNRPKPGNQIRGNGQRQSPRSHFHRGQLEGPQQKG